MKDYMLVTSNTNSAGRISGEITGNAYLTFKNYDPYNGNLNEIKTGVNMNKPIRHLVYGYDNNANVVVSEKLDFRFGLFQGKTPIRSTGKAEKIGVPSHRPNHCPTDFPVDFF